MYTKVKLGVAIFVGLIEEALHPSTPTQESVHKINHPLSLSLTQTHIQTFFLSNADSIFEIEYVSPISDIY